MNDTASTDTITTERCNFSQQSPDVETFARRRGGVVTCPGCGTDVPLFMRRMDWSTASHTYMADHDIPAGGPAVVKAPAVATLRDQLQRLGHDVDADPCIQLEWLRISDWMRRDLDTPCTVVLATPALFIGNNRAVLQIRWRKRDDPASWAHRGNAYVVFVDEGVGHYELVQAG